jgi:micrococcal nuclease
MAATMTPRLVEQMLAALHGAEGRWAPSAEPLAVALKLDSTDEIRAASQTLRSWGVEVVGSDPTGPALSCRVPAERLWDILGMDGVLELAEEEAPGPGRAPLLRWAALAAAALAVGIVIWSLVGGGATLLPGMVEVKRGAEGTLPERGEVESVLSGNSLKLATGPLIRLAGLSAPAYGVPYGGEEVYGPESRRALKELVEGRAVNLAYPPRPNASGGALLAYVSLSDGRDVNAALLEGGFAQLDIASAGPARRAAYTRLEAEAREGKRGLWGGPVVGNLSSKVYHMPGGRFYHRVSPDNRVLFATEAEARSAGYRPSAR